MATTRHPPRRLSSDALAVVARLAALSRPPASDGERAAAETLAGAFAQRGAQVRIEEEQVHGTYWVPIGLYTAVAALAGAAGGTAATLGGLASACAAADDLEIGRRPVRRLLGQHTCHNVVVEIAPREPDGVVEIPPREPSGVVDDPAREPRGQTLVVHAHHDAARTGLVFHPAIAKLMARVAGGLIDRIGGTPAPMWGAVHGPAAVFAGSLLGSRRLRFAGTALSAGFAAAMANIAFSPPVPGANDNLSGVGVLLELAEALVRNPPRHLRVLLLSTGSEESFLEAMVRFGERHFPELPRERTTFLCLESVGSPQLMLLSGEGLLRLVRYPQKTMDELSQLAQEIGVALRDPFRYRLATDGQVPLRGGYRTAVISSMDWDKAPTNYHWPTDNPENLTSETIADAFALAEAFVRRLDANE